MKIKWICSIMALFILANCSTQVGIEKGRSLASDEKDCAKLMMVLFKKATNEIDTEYTNKLDDKAYTFWKYYYQKFLLNPAKWSPQFVKKVYQRFQAFNNNKVPAYFLMDSEETVPVVEKIRSYFKNDAFAALDSSFSRREDDAFNTDINNWNPQNWKKETLNQDEPQFIPDGDTPSLGSAVDDWSEPNTAVKEAFIEIRKWIDRYEDFPNRMNLLIQEYGSYDLAIAQGRKIRSQIKGGKIDYPIVEKFIFYKNGVKNVELKKFFDEEQLINFISQLKESQRVLHGGLIVKKGNLTDVSLKQAEDFERLTHLFRALKNTQLTNQNNGQGSEFTNNILGDLVSRLEKILGDDLLKPGKRYQARLALDVFKKELANLKQTVEEQKLYEATRNFWKNLSEEERELIGVNDRGRSGEVFRLIKQSRLTQFGLLLVGISGGSAGVYELYNMVWELFVTEQEKMMRCAIKDTDEEFWSCSEEYFQDRFKLQYPISYVIKGNVGLREAVDGDEEVFSEFQKRWKLMVKARTDFKVKEAMEEKARIENEELIRTLMQKELKELGIDYKLDDEGEYTLTPQQEETLNNWISNVEDIIDVAPRSWDKVNE
jgi:hypothetical protein